MRRSHKCSGVAVAVTLSILAGCGGGSGSSTPVNYYPSVTNEPSWEPGVYESQSSFIAQCESPKKGIDPFPRLA
jgi:hypothetical protein